MRILHIEDSNLDAELISPLLTQAWPECEIQRAASKAELGERLRSGDFDVVVSDFTLADLDGLTALEMTRTRFPNKPFIFFSGTIGEDRAVEALKRGASDYVLKDRPARLIPAIRQAMAAAEQTELQRRTSTALERSEMRIREQATLLNKAQDAILACDVHNRITYWNEGALRVYGWTAAEATGRDAIALLAFEPLAFETARAESLSNGEWHGELTHMTKSGERVIVQSGWTLIHTDAKGPDTFLIINTNITEKKRMEAQFLRAQRTESLGLMASGIAHDLNNVLAPILISLEIIRGSVPDPQISMLVGHMEASAKHGSALVKQLLAFARGVDGKMVEVSLDAFVQEFAPFIRATLGSSMKVVVEMRDKPPAVHADVTQLRQILVNLCLNARDAMNEKGTITLGAERFHLDARDDLPHPDARPGDYAVISVADSGSGIAPSDLDRIFDPFFTTKELGKGTGLGLATVLGIVKGHGGFVTVDSEQGKGTVFRIFLPTDRQSKLPPQRSATPEGTKILLIEDDASVRTTMQFMLGGYGYAVLTADNGFAGLEVVKAAKGRIDLILTDLQMPVMGGLELIGQLKEDFPSLPVVAMTGHASDPEAASQLKARKIPLVEKPISREDLHSVIESTLAARA